MYCHTCGECFKNLLERTIHEANEHKQIIIKEKRTTERKTHKPYQPLEFIRSTICLWCNSTFDTHQAMLDHSIIHSKSKSVSVKTHSDSKI